MGFVAIYCRRTYQKKTAPFSVPYGERVFSQRPGPWFNIKMSSYQYRKSHCWDKTVVRSSYLHNGISYTGKISSLYWIGPQDLGGADQANWTPCVCPYGPRAFSSSWDSHKTSRPMPWSSLTPPHIGRPAPNLEPSAIGFRSGFSRREISSVYPWCCWQWTKIERRNSTRKIWLKA